MSVELLTILMFACCFGAMFLGLPVALAFGGTAVVFAILLTPRTLIAVPSAFYQSCYEEAFLAFPMFILMGNLIRYSGVAEAAYDMAYKFLGTIPGGLAMGTVVICTFFAAVTGITPTATIAMGLVAIPNMLKHRYHKTIAIGSVGAGGALGALIPPSIPFIIYAIIARESVGALFMGGVMPGLMLSTMFIIYIGIRCQLRPDMGPTIPPDERVSWGERFKSVTAIWPFLVLIGLVLGTIWGGVATPTEAACFGAGGALLITLIFRRLTWGVLRDSLTYTVRLTVMGLFIFIGVMLFINIFSALGCQELITKTLMAVPGGRWGVLATMMVTILLLGTMMDDWAIIIFTTPLYVPILVDLGFSKLWYGILLIVNIQVAYQSPPFGFVLFWLKSITPPDVTMGDIYRSTFPFVILKIIGLALIMIFPQIGLWLPTTMIKR